MYYKNLTNLKNVKKYKLIISYFNFFSIETQFLIEKHCLKCFKCTKV